MGVCTIVSRQLELHCLCCAISLAETDREAGFDFGEDYFSDFLFIYWEAMNNLRAPPHLIRMAPNWLTISDINRMLK
jgi:hypothetical protein